MLVQATQIGYYGHIRHPGDQFQLKKAEHFSKMWMRKLSDEEALEAASHEEDSQDSEVFEQPKKQAKKKPKKASESSEQV